MKRKLEKIIYTVAGLLVFAALIEMSLQILEKS